MPATERPYQTALVAVLQRTAEVRVWRQNSGKVQTVHGTWIELAPKGAADITGIVLGSGQRLEIECKSPTGKQSDEQKRWGEFIARSGGIYLLAKPGKDESPASYAARIREELLRTIRNHGHGPGNTPAVHPGRPRP